MNSMENWMATINSFVWGPFTITLLVLVGIVFSFGTGFIQFRHLFTAFKLLKNPNQGDGDISPFQSLMTSLAATIGTGNIAGVATAITAGGPGAIFWMWVTAALGGSVKYAEALLALKYRITNEQGERSGGPMYYIEKGLGKNFKWLAVLFAVFTVLASFGIGNMVQANSMASALHGSLHIPLWITGVLCATFTGLVILGGIKSIARVTAKIVPFMAIIYVVGSLIILIANAQALPHAIGLIFTNAFTGQAVGGGVLGTVIRFGVARGLFSNEAGLGSAPIAHAASRNNDPVKQGLVGSLGSFIDTIIICTMTALVILVSGMVDLDAAGIMTVQDNLTGAQLTARAYAIGLPGIGGFVVSFGLIFFTFSTLIGWSYYGAKALEYLLGVGAVLYYRILWVLLAGLGAVLQVEFVWNFSDTFNGLMALPNLIALLFLSPVVFSMTRQFKNPNSVQK
jgi:alanine or glycine:cation symporter, AGCS family